MSKEANDLACKIWSELAAADPEGEVERSAVQAEVRRRLVLDVDKLRDAAAKAATDAAYDRLTRWNVEQPPLPGLPPPEGAFLAFERDKTVEARMAKLQHIVGATRIRQANANDVNAALAAWQAAMLPQLVYFAQGMTWSEVAAAYRRDHPDAAAAD